MTVYPDTSCMPLRTGVIGVGNAGISHMDVLQRNPRTKLSAVFDTNVSRMEKTSISYDVETCSTMEEFIELGLDWIHICTPVQSHFDLGKMVIEQDIPVLIEKPVTTNSSELTRLRQLSEARGVHISVVHNYLFLPVVRKIRDEITKGQFGTIHGISVIFAGTTKPDDTDRGDWVFELPGGEFEEGLPHPIYLCLTLGGYPQSKSRISTMSSLIGEYDRGFAYDNIQVSYENGNGGICEIRVTTNPVPLRYIFIHGDQQSAIVDYLTNSCAKINGNHMPIYSRPKFDAKIGFSRFANIGSTARRYSDMFIEKKFNRHSENSKFNLYYQINEEAKFLLDNCEPVVSMEEAQWTREIMDLMQEEAAVRMENIPGS